MDIYILDLTQPIVLLAAILVYAFFMILGKELKKSSLPAVSLFLFLITLGIYGIEFFFVTALGDKQLIMSSIGYNAVLIFLSYISYLWVDDIESKEKKIKSIDNSLEWFWKKV